MRCLTFDGLTSLLTLAGLSVADHGLGIGSELAHRTSPPRRIVVHFAEHDSPDHMIGIASRVLALDSEWVLYPRYGSIAGLALPGQFSEGSAVQFSESEKPQLALYLCTRSVHPDSAAADLYIVGSAGRVLVTWDHHTAAEGLSIALQSVADASKLLVSLNEFGAELELICGSG